MGLLPNLGIGTARSPESGNRAEDLLSTSGHRSEERAAEGTTRCVDSCLLRGIVPIAKEVVPSVTRRKAYTRTNEYREYYTITSMIVSCDAPAKVRSSIPSKTQNSLGTLPSTESFI